MARNARYGTVRIIGGQWRSRRLEFPDREALRPTPDRVRETVFNWLAPWLPGAQVLDLFAGSGAFGFEALSRGATRAVLVEHDPDTLAALHDNRLQLAAQAADIVRGDALAYLDGIAEPFDVVFLDPPYRSALLQPCLQRLAERGWVKPGGLVYLESREGAVPELPARWTWMRHKSAGQVGYHLARTPGAEEAA